METKRREEFDRKHSLGLSGCLYDSTLYAIFLSCCLHVSFKNIVLVFKASQSIYKYKGFYYRLYPCLKMQYKIIYSWTLVGVCGLYCTPGQ